MGCGTSLFGDRQRKKHQNGNDNNSSALDVLKMRLARGEVAPDEYEKTKEMLVK